MRILITFLITFLSQQSLALESCKFENENIKNVIPSLCEEGRLCWDLKQSGQCIISQATPNYKDGFDMSDESFSNAIKYRNLFYSELSEENKKNAHNIILQPSKELLSYPESNFFAQ